MEKILEASKILMHKSELSKEEKLVLLQVIHRLFEENNVGEKENYRISLKIFFRQFFTSDNWKEFLTNKQFDYSVIPITTVIAKDIGASKFDYKQMQKIVVELCLLDINDFNINRAFEAVDTLKKKTLNIIF